MTNHTGTYHFLLCAYIDCLCVCSALCYTSLEVLQVGKCGPLTMHHYISGTAYQHCMHCYHDAVGQMKTNLSSLIPRPLPDFISIRGEKSGEGLGSKLCHGAEMVDSV